MCTYVSCHGNKLYVAMKQTANKEHGNNWWVKQNNVAEHKIFQGAPLPVLAVIIHMRRHYYVY